MVVKFSLANCCGSQKKKHLQAGIVPDAGGLQETDCAALPVPEPMRPGLDFGV